LDGLRQGDGTCSHADISLVLHPDCRQVRTQSLDQDAGQDRSAILLALTSTNDDLTAIEVDVFCPQVQRLEQAQARAIQECAHQPDRTLDVRRKAARLFPPEHDRDVYRPLGVDQVAQPLEFAPKHLLVQEQQRGQGLVLCRGADLCFTGQTGQLKERAWPARRILAHRDSPVHSWLSQRR
jgi:hypothetical protein